MNQACGFQGSVFHETTYFWVISPDFSDFHATRCSEKSHWKGSYRHSLSQDLRCNLVRWEVHILGCLWEQLVLPWLLLSKLTEQVRVVTHHVPQSFSWAPDPSQPPPTPTPLNPRGFPELHYILGRGGGWSFCDLGLSFEVRKDSSKLWLVKMYMIWKKNNLLLFNGSVCNFCSDQF
jgi:hypothetical protein